jgi:hypothetical protein
MADETIRSLLKIETEEILPIVPTGVGAGPERLQGASIAS